MKKILALTLIILTMCLLFTACKCEHQYEEKVTKEASCSAVGIKTFACTLCEESYTEEIPMIEHTYTSAVTKESTCAEKGTTTFTCTVCDHSYTEEIEMVAHTLGEATVTKELTCTEEGEKVATCTVCGAPGVSETIAKVEHTYTSRVTKEPTCTATGTKTLTCSGCGGTKTENVAQLGHNYTQTEIKKVTCTEDGTRRVSCSRCGDSYDEVVKSTGHNWKNATCTQAKRCSSCGQTSGTALGHTTNNGTCSRCNETINPYSITLKTSLPFTCYYRYSLAEANSSVKITRLLSATFNRDGSTLTVKLQGTIIYPVDSTRSAWIKVKLTCPDGTTRTETTFERGDAGDTVAFDVRLFDLAGDPGEYIIEIQNYYI